MPQTVTVVTPPAAEPVTLAEARLHLRVPDDLTADDALISSLVTAARRVAEAWSKTVFVNTVFDVVEDGFPVNSGYINRLLRANPVSYQGGVYSSPPAAFFPSNVGIITLPRMPLVSVTSVTYLDAAGVLRTMDPSLYAVTTGSPGRLAPAFGQIWPVTRPQIGAVTLRITAGCGVTAASVPENVKAAIKLLVGHWYEHREAVSVDVGQTVQTLPVAVEHLLAIETQWSYA